MKKQILILALAILLAGCVGPQMAPPYNDQSYGQTYGGGYNALPPSNSYATPWVGANTPWVYYQNDWFLNGVLYHNYGNQYGWAPYYSYPPTYIVRPNNWYGPRWHTWYQQNPHYHQNFTQKYPYWRGHHPGQRYDQNFYNQHHQGQGGGWHKGFHGGQTPGTYGPAGRGPGAAGPGGHTPGTTGPAVRTPGGLVLGPGSRVGGSTLGPGPAAAPGTRSGGSHSWNHWSYGSHSWWYWSWRPYPWDHRSGGSHPWGPWSGGARPCWYRSGGSHPWNHWSYGSHSWWCWSWRPYPWDHRSPRRFAPPGLLVRQLVLLVVPVLRFVPWGYLLRRPAPQEPLTLAGKNRQKLLRR